jgi:hypothetical protein
MINEGRAVAKRVLDAFLFLKILFYINSLSFKSVIVFLINISYEALHWYFFRLRDKNLNLYIHKWIYTAKGYTTTEYIDSKPLTEVNQETRRKTHKQKKGRLSFNLHLCRGQP